MFLSSVERSFRFQVDVGRYYNLIVYEIESEWFIFNWLIQIIPSTKYQCPGPLARANYIGALNTIDPFWKGKTLGTSDAIV